MATNQPKPPVRGGLAEVEEYLAALPDGPRPLMEQIRAAIRLVAPEAVEVLSYGMPAFTQGGQRFIYYAAWQNHCSVYGLPNSVLNKFEQEVASYVTPKGMLKFAFDEDLPEELIESLVRARLAELEKE